jgi:hypothetical protein
VNLVRDKPTHAVTVLPGSRPAALAGHGELAVNSFHRGGPSLAQSA